MPTTAEGSARRQLNDVYVCICYLREKLAAVRKGLLNIKQRNVFRQITVDIFVAQMTGRDGTCYSECSGRFCGRANCYVKPETACRLVLCRRFSIQGGRILQRYTFSVVFCSSSMRLASHRSVLKRRTVFWSPLTKQQASRAGIAAPFFRRPLRCPRGAGAAELRRRNQGRR